MERAVEELYEFDALIRFFGRIRRTVAPKLRSPRCGPVVSWESRERYPRAEVPRFFGFELKGFEAQEGIVTRPGLILLFVTLDKSGKPEEHRYEDAFVSPTEFRWQSQNRTARDSKMGRMIQNHRASSRAETHAADR